MTSGQDTNSKTQADPLESSKDAAQNQTPQISPAADALGDSSLDEVSGGAWPLTISRYNTGQGG